MKYNELYEKKKHGSEEFPIQYDYVDKNHHQYIMPLHWHKEFEIIHIISGKFKLFVSNIEYNMKQGDIAFVGCGLLHRGEPDNCIYEVSVFDINMLRRRQGDIITPLLTPIMSGDSFVTTLSPLGEDERLHAAVISFFNAMHYKEGYYELAVYGLLFNIFSVLYSHEKINSVQNPQKGRHKTEAITSLIDWIEQHYTEHITLNRLACICGMNKKYLCHLFREFTERTPIEYINSIRIESACHEMTVNHRTVTEAAMESGFNDPSYFARTFKKHKGMTPKKYMKEQIKNQRNNL